MKKVGLLICLALLTGCTSKLESKIEITDNNKETVIELQDKSFITKYNVLYNGKDIKRFSDGKYKSVTVNQEVKKRCGDGHYGGCIVIKK